ncbi:hypothetical protein [Plantactinospora sp. GCM10030261]|uniref:hypothetical protein n=1 Tax=Plantactinospora sp. GCM10030261 TaxID=3273420 RepID=UPI00361E4093
MSIEIGIVGPHDLVDEVADTCEEQPGIIARRLDYDHETQAPAIVEAHAGQLVAWLFTGVVPYTLAREADVLSRPAVFVDYTGATLLQAAVRLLHEGHDVTRISIDTVAVGDVTTTFADAGLPVDRVRVLPYRSGLGSDDLIAFHRRHRRSGTTAVTCLSSVHEALRQEMPAFRLAPSSHAVRTALRQLMLQASSQAQEDAQIALGLVELPDADGLLREVAALGGTLAGFAHGTHLIVTTRGPLHEATAGFTTLPMLRRLVDRYDTVRIGFGLGNSAAEAENLARRALSRARRIGPTAAVLALRGDTDIVLDATVPMPPAREQNLAVIAQRVGLSVPTLLRLRQVRDATGVEPLTSRDVARHLTIAQRTARRMLHRLELAGLAERTGNLASGGSGRPLTLYRLTL